MCVLISRYCNGVIVPPSAMFGTVLDRLMNRLVSRDVYVLCVLLGNGIIKLERKLVMHMFYMGFANLSIKYSVFY